MRLTLALALGCAMALSAAAQALPVITDEMLKQAGAILHVDVKTGRLAGITDRGPVAEVGAKVVEVLYGDHKSDEWIAYSQRVEADYQKPAVSQRLLLLSREGDRSPLLDADYSPASREALAKKLADHRARSELLTGEMHVPDYLLRSASNALLHVEVRKTTPYERGRGYLSATHVATVIGAAQGELKPGDSIEYVQETNRQKRMEPNASAQRIVLLHYTRSTQDGQMKWWVHERVNYGYTEAGFTTLKADVARVRAAQAEKAAKDVRK